jgi:2-polyprenyl-6-methoxyphenol hydroxylase-like FAD-dependent oxidoreductase
MGYFGNSFSINRGRGQRGNLRVPRKVLRRILFQTLLKTTNVYWDHRLVDYTWDSETSQYHLDFQTSPEGKMTTIVADLLVAADGIRSAVLQKLYQSPKAPAEKPEGTCSCTATISSSTRFGLRYMGVRLILGIADFSHPILHERGFYTLDGKHRLFTMPYQSSRFGNKKNRIMWQLSFAMDDPNQSLDASSLLDYVVETCRSWHSPVLDMIEATPLETIWGT